MESIAKSINLEYPLFIDSLHEIFISNGYQLYLVGGCVRDTLMGKTPKDFDLVTDAPISDVVNMLMMNNVEYNEQGKSFGIVVAYDGDNDYEIAQFRSDIVDKTDYIEFALSYNVNQAAITAIINNNDDFRDVLITQYPDFIDSFDHSLRKNQKVKLGVDINTDAERRDLTINALYYDIANKSVIDLVGGLTDIRSNTIRMVGKVSDRIREDRLRILRVGRFLSRMDATLSQNIVDELSNNNDIRSVSYERIWDEFTKAFSTSKNIMKYINFIHEFKLIDQFLYKFKINSNVIVSDDLILYLSSVLYDDTINNNITTELVKHSKIPYNVAAKIAYMVLFVNKFEPSMVFNFHKHKQQISMDNETLMKFCEHVGMMEYIDAFIEYKPTYDMVEIARNNNIILDANNKPTNTNDGILIGKLISKFEEDAFNKLMLK